MYQAVSPDLVNQTRAPDNKYGLEDGRVVRAARQRAPYCGQRAAQLVAEQVHPGARRRILHDRGGDVRVPTRSG